MDTALKQRLVGASVLIALAVVVLPMLLGGRPDNTNPASQKIELPPQPAELDFETRRYPIGEQKSPAPRERSASASKPLPSPSRPVESPPAGTLEPESAGEEATDSSIESLPAVVPVTSPSTDSGRYIVQVASFGAVDNANRLSETLRSYGYDVLVDTVKSDVGTLHRVRVGPYASESDASGVVSKLQSQVAGIKPRVMDLQPEKVAQVTKPSDPLVRWVVQVGSFSSAANADKLVARLKLESLTAYKEQVSSSGNVIYRVRVGPFLEREEALRADTLITDRMSIDGVVMSAD
jgi:DedD protein